MANAELTYAADVENMTGQWNPKTDEESDDDMLTNARREEWAEEAIHTFAEATGVEDEDTDTKVSDLLANLMHLCRRDGVDFIACLNRGAMHHQAERDGEL